MSIKLFRATILTAATIMIISPATANGKILAQSQNEQLSSSAINAAITQIQQIQQQINALKQVSVNQSAGVVTDQAKLAYIQRRVNEIRMQKDQIAIQVAQIVKARQEKYAQISAQLALIQKQAQLIQQQVQALGCASATALVPLAPTSGANTQEIEKQIAGIQDQIKILTQRKDELAAVSETQSGAQNVQSSALTPSAESSADEKNANQNAAITCDTTTGVCSITQTQNQTTPQSETSQGAKLSESLWSKIWNFIGNLFTF